MVTIKATKYVSEYVRSHPYVKEALTKKIVNYSKLARKIIDEGGVHLSCDAVIVALRRLAGSTFTYRGLSGLSRQNVGQNAGERDGELKSKKMYGKDKGGDNDEFNAKEEFFGDKIKNVLGGARIEVKNKRSVAVVKKLIGVDGIERLKREENAAVVEVMGYYIIFYCVGDNGVEEKIRNFLEEKHENVIEICLKFPKDVVKTSGVLGYVYGIFGEHGINILEAVSCYDESIIVIDERDMGKVVEALRF